MKFIGLLICVLALASCGGTSEVVRAGPGTYMISSGGGMYTQNPSGIRQKVFERANAYCDAMGKSMVQVDVNERPYALGSHTASIELTFKCQ
jgi:hypothetical protein